MRDIASTKRSRQAECRDLLFHSNRSKYRLHEIIFTNAILQHLTVLHSIVPHNCALLTKWN
jgi:hypothetical protein